MGGASRGRGFPGWAGLPHKSWGTSERVRGVLAPPMGENHQLAVEAGLSVAFSSPEDGTLGHLSLLHVVISLTSVFCTRWCNSWGPKSSCFVLLWVPSVWLPAWSTLDAAELQHHLLSSSCVPVPGPGLGRSREPALAWRTVSLTSLLCVPRAHPFPPFPPLPRSSPCRAMFCDGARDAWTEPRPQAAGAHALPGCGQEP